MSARPNVQLPQPTIRLLLTVTNINRIIRLGVIKKNKNAIPRWSLFAGNRRQLVAMLLHPGRWYTYKCELMTTQIS